MGAIPGSRSVMTTGAASRSLALLTIICALVATTGAGAPALDPAGPPSHFRSTLVVGPLGQGAGGIPTAFAYAPDGRIFVARKTGVVNVYDHGVMHVFLDVSDEVNSAQGRGMLGLALDPSFAANGRVYVIFTQELHPGRPDAPGDAGGEIVRFSARASDPDVANLASRVTLLRGYKSTAPQHADVALRFDAAGHLLAGFGDATGDRVNPTALRAQNLSDLRGKIIRINRYTGAGVAGNPWYDPTHPGSVRSKVFAYGLRNPFRFTVDPHNGTLYVGDVGWKDFEELDAFPVQTRHPLRDRNGGWPCYEGAMSHSTPQVDYETNPLTRDACKRLYPARLGGSGLGAQKPLYSYRHDGGACIIVGPKYVGTANYPAKYTGKIFVADWARDLFRTVDPLTGVATDFGSPGGWNQPVDIQIAPDGNVAYLALGTNTLREITYTP